MYELSENQERVKERNLDKRANRIRQGYFIPAVRTTEERYKTDTPLNSIRFSFNVLRSRSLGSSNW